MHNESTEKKMKPGPREAYGNPRNGPLFSCIRLAPMASLKAWWRWLVRQLRSISRRKESGRTDEADEMEDRSPEQSKANAFFGRIKQRLSSRTPASERPATWDDYSRAYAQGRIDVTDPPEPPITISLPSPDQAPPVPPKDEQPSNPYTRGFWPAPAPVNEKKRLLATRVSLRARPSPALLLHPLTSPTDRLISVFAAYRRFRSPRSTPRS
jgi:hypothetical protein